MRTTLVLISSGSRLFRQMVFAPLMMMMLAVLVMCPRQEYWGSWEQQPSNHTGQKTLQLLISVTIPCCKYCSICRNDVLWAFSTVCPLVCFMSLQKKNLQTGTSSENKLNLCFGGTCEACTLQINIHNTRIKEKGPVKFTGLRGSAEGCYPAFSEVSAYSTSKHDIKISMKHDSSFTFSPPKLDYFPPGDTFLTGQTLPIPGIEGGEA